MAGSGIRNESPRCSAHKTPSFDSHSGQGPSVVPVITSMPTQGMFEVGDIDFFMPGIWTNTFTITPASGPEESVVFTFCVSG